MEQTRESGLKKKTYYIQEGNRGIERIEAEVSKLMDGSITRRSELALRSRKPSKLVINQGLRR